MKNTFYFLTTICLMLACNTSDMEVSHKETKNDRIIPRSTIDHVVILDRLDGSGTYNSSTHTYLITTLTNVDFQPYGDSNWYSYTGKNYKVKCNCGSGAETAGCSPHFVASDPPDYSCTNDSCTQTCELSVTVTETAQNGGGTIAVYVHGGTFRAHQ